MLRGETSFEKSKMDEFAVDDDLDFLLLEGNVWNLKIEVSPPLFFSSKFSSFSFFLQEKSEILAEKSSKGIRTGFECGARIYKISSASLI